VQHTISHRRDIDGLRAAAVLSVLFYHAHIPGFRGGFAGVDVFFVISGFLIAGHIGDAIGTGHFSLLDFYERRIRRIFPALFFMYAVVLLVASAIEFPPDLARFTKIGRFVIPFLANFEIYRTLGGYSGAYAQRSPLLHTWSLAVEEQFYLLFPLLMLLIGRFAGRRYWLTLGPLALLSFLACAVAARIAPLSAFYLPQFRAWELLAGALLALGKFPAPRNPHWRSGLALTGLALIAMSDALFSGDTPFPSEYALMPCAGASLILYAVCDSSLPAGRILDNPVMVRIGLWSYSLYLFHWPLLVLVQYYAFTPLPFVARALILAVSVAISALSWRFVEQPFRGKGALFSRGQLFAVASIAGIALLLATQFSTYANPYRYVARQRDFFPAYTAAQQQCWDRAPWEVAQKPVCKLGTASVPADTILWGDSHARALVPAVDAVFAKHGRAAMFEGMGGCPPLLDVQLRWIRPITSRAILAMLGAVHLAPRQDCKRHNDAVLQWAIEHKISTVILAAHWLAYADTQSVPTARAAHTVFIDTRTPDDGSPVYGAAVFARGFDRILDALQRQHVKVFVMNDAPWVGVNIPYALASTRRLGERRDFTITRAAYEAQQHVVTPILAALQDRYAFTILRPEDLLCAGGVCAVERGGRPFYMDDEHLSPLGALAAGPAFERIWSPAR
jgi:peptidoglycan/LPS O-acetylase OafA/YrhL